MRNFTIGLITIFWSIVALGQVPQGITYQSVVRNPDGTIVSNAALSMQLTIRSGAPDGQIEYVEIHETQSNAYGLVNLIIGSGTVQEGDFSSINWGSNAMFLETAIDLNNSGSYESMGVTQFLSVPYSMFSGNGVHSMTTEERDALENPPLGMQIFNITTNCINYYNGYDWYETCGDCTPLPSEADAGPDQSFTGETTTAQMAANTPESGEGLWSVVSGEGGSFDDLSNPAATFSGQPCESYTLAWTITSPCGASEDLVDIVFDTPPSIANAGPDQTFNDATISAALAANTPTIGTGTWTVEIGIGGSFGDVNDPTTSFTGQPCETYTLKWTITNDCGTGEDFVDIIFNTPPTTADAGPDQTFIDTTISTALAANTPLLGAGTWSIESGTGGSFGDLNDPTTTFTGQPCETYTLKWTITNDCGTSEDFVEITFNTPPTIADAGADQLDVQGTSTTLAGNTPVLGTGNWSILSGNGGIITEPTNPVSIFSGVEGETYELLWTITNSCGSSSDQVIISFAGGGGSWECGQPITDDRDGQQYETVLIGDQCWMAENLNVGSLVNGSEDQTDDGALEKYCYDDDPANCDTYGGLYQWDEMMQYTTDEGAQGICPDGWYIPTDEEFKMLEGAVDSQYGYPDPEWDINGARGTDAGGNLKEAGYEHWVTPNIGATNSSGFTALPGGSRPPNGLFGNLGYYGYWWSSTQVIARYVTYGHSRVIRGSFDRKHGWSVRCLKSDNVPVNQPPDAPTTPSPENGATNLSIEGTNLSWIGSDPENDPLTYDVYFGTNNPPAPVSTGQSEATYDPGTLQNTTEYFWNIVANDDQGNATEGPVWSFITMDSTTTAFTCGDSLVDNRDGNKYATTQIGSQCWMAENLAFLPAVSPSETGSSTVSHYYVYDYQGTDVATAKATSNYQNYGTLYNWPALMNGWESSDSVPSGVQGVCPAGWHVPSDEEWKILEGEADSQYDYPDPVWNATSWRGTDVGGNLKQQGTTYWYSPNNGATNNSGFTALPSGDRKGDGSFGNLSYIGFFWTSTENGSNQAFFRYLQYHETRSLRANNYEKDYGLSVRCVHNELINQPPDSPSNPSPLDGAVNLPVEGTALSWSCSDPDSDTLTYDVYFGDTNPPSLHSSGQSDTSYATGILNYNTTYFWQIVAHDGQGLSTEGPVWSFTAADSVLNVFNCGDTLVDSRDGNKYASVQIGNQCWMAENLAFLPSVSPSAAGSTSDPYYYVLDYQGTDVAAAKATSNYQSYGALYNWPAVMSGQAGSDSVPSGVQGVCPTGWHVPSDEEFKILEGEVDTQYGYPDPEWDQLNFRGFDAGLHLREQGTDHWSAPNTGATNSSGFTALPTGIRSGATFSYPTIGFFWTSTQFGTTKAYFRYLQHNQDGILRYNNYSLSHALPVRCIRDGEPENEPPDAPSNPIPQDGTTSVPVEGETLYWSVSDPENDPLTYDVYFGTNNPPAQVSTGQSENTYDPGTLQYNTEYFWKIVAHDDQGNSTEGPVWSFTTGEEGTAFNCGDVLTDFRDGQQYETVVIGDQCWMAENLNVGTHINTNVGQDDNETIEKHCYGNLETNCDTYGGLYQWDEMMQFVTTEGTQGICPDGWYLPSDSDLSTLVTYVNDNGFAGTEGTALKSTTYWGPGQNGTDDFGFTGLPAGYTNVISYLLGDKTYFWSSTESSAGAASLRSLDGGAGVLIYSLAKSYGFSVRCLKSEALPNQAPEVPSSPNPQDGVANQPFEGITLSWTCSDPENDPLTYDVYFGTENPPAQVSTGQSEATYDPGTLQYSTEYFWKIVAHDDQGNATEGPVWSFTTEEETAQFSCGDTFIDSRDDNTYATVQIGDQCWMAENLAFLPSVSPSSDGSDAAPYYYVFDYQGTDIAAAKATQNYQDYGVLYNWPAAQNACPEGWHTPNDAEWKILEGNADSQYPVGDPFWDQTGYRGFDTNKNLKSTTGWNDNGNGTDLFGFSALPAGGRAFDTGSFYGLGSGARFWTLTEASAENGWYRILFAVTDSSYRAAWHKGLGFSMRCVYGEAPANQPPSAPHYAVPENLSTEQPVEGTILSWSSLDADNDPITYDVYFGTSETPPSVATGQSGSTFEPGTLQYETWYYWRIVAHDDQGNTTNGPMWRFQTEVETVSFNCGDVITDSRDGQQYETVLIGDQCWMAENLAYLPEVYPSSQGSNTDPYYYVYDYQGTSVAEAQATTNYQTYGVLYNWPASLDACPEGWHLPADAEWTALTDYVSSQPEHLCNGDDFYIAKALAATTNWTSASETCAVGNNLSANNSTGFSGLPGGFRNSDWDSFFAMNADVYWWSSTESSAAAVWHRNMYNHFAFVSRGGNPKGDGLSVRCMRD